ncbi:hypothetical protein L1049_015917 [Liquidambar formosana]|uniref:ATP-dependent DNA helicase n=1 Tax=Liquidambar formosana TaxID=63359 RepID=A0AAP0RYJ4_LIQFO
MFATMLIFCEVTNPCDLWAKYCEIFVDDLYLRSIRELGNMALELPHDELKNMALCEIENILNKSDRAFSGTAVLFGEDFRKLLPVVPKKSREGIVVASLQRSDLWAECHVFRLTTNMRVSLGNLTDETRKEVEDFSKWILDVGDGILPSLPLSANGESNWIRIPNDLLIKDQGRGIQVLIDDIYPNLKEHYLDSSYLQKRAILAPKNVDVDEIN